MELVTVGNYADLASAEVAASLLEAAEIECVIPDENFAAISWQMGTALQGVRLQVADENLELARIALENTGEPPAWGEEGAQLPSPEDVCVVCGSESVGQPKWKNRLKAIGIFFPPVLLVWPLLAAVNSRSQCSSCGHAWR
jgi:Putative prokaryotic signal transducing protein